MMPDGMIIDAVAQSRVQSEIARCHLRMYGDAMECIDIDHKLSLFTDHWSPRIITSLNGQDIKLAKFSGEFDWHSHADEDELFLVLKGWFIMEFRDRSVEVHEGQMIVVPRGVEHRPVAKEECAVLLCEPAGLLNTGDGPESDRTTSGEWI